MVPFVPFAGPRAGLGQGTPATVEIQPSSLPWWQQIVIPVGQQVGSAVSQRIAYGQQPYFGASGFFLQPGAGSPYYGTGFGGFDPRTLLLLGAGLALVVFLSRR